MHLVMSCATSMLFRKPQISSADLGPSLLLPTTAQISSPSASIVLVLPPFEFQGPARTEIQR